MRPGGFASETFVAALHRLDPAYRALLELSYRRGVPDADIAVLLGGATDDVERQLRTALEMLAASVWPPGDVDRVRAALMELPGDAWEHSEHDRRTGGILVAAALAGVVALVLAVPLIPAPGDAPALTASRESGLLGLSPDALTGGLERDGGGSGGDAGSGRGGSGAAGIAEPSERPGDRTGSSGGGSDPGGGRDGAGPDGRSSPGASSGGDGGGTAGGSGAGGGSSTGGSENGGGGPGGPGDGTADNPPPGETGGGDPDPPGDGDPGDGEPPPDDGDPPPDDGDPPPGSGDPPPDDGDPPPGDGDPPPDDGEPPPGDGDPGTDPNAGG